MAPGDRDSTSDGADASPPPPPDAAGASDRPASPGERRRERLEQNRISARESRKRRKNMIEDLQRTVIELSRENKELNERNEGLRTELVELGTAHPGAVDLNRMLSCSNARGGDAAVGAAGGGGGGAGEPPGRGRPRSTDEGVVQEALTAAAEQINDQATAGLVNLRNARLEGERPGGGGGAGGEGRGGVDMPAWPDGPNDAGRPPGDGCDDPAPPAPVPRRSPSEIKSAALDAAQNAAAQRRAHEAAARHIAIYQMMAAGAEAEARRREEQSRMVGLAVARMQRGGVSGAGPCDPSQAAMPPQASAAAPPAAAAATWRDDGPRAAADDVRRDEGGDPGRGGHGERSEA